MAELRRHWLVHVDPGAWPAIVGDRASPLLRDWAKAGRPAIIRRADCRDTGSGVPVGVPLPPAHGKARIALHAPAPAIRSIDPPPLLREAAAAAPTGWHETIGALLASFPDARCYGSLAWQHLTGLAYVTEGSDLDLLIECRNRSAADHAAKELAGIEGMGAMRIDAELVNRAGGAVHWREWHDRREELLVKSVHDIAITPRSTLFA